MLIRHPTVPFCGNFPPQMFNYFWRNGKIFRSATRIKYALQKKNVFPLKTFWIFWSWQSPQCGFDGNRVGHLSKHLHKSLIYLFRHLESRQRNKSQSVSIVCCGHIFPDIVKRLSGLSQKKSIFPEMFSLSLSSSLPYHSSSARAWLSVFKFKTSKYYKTCKIDLNRFGKVLWSPCVVVIIIPKIGLVFYVLEKAQNPLLRNNYFTVLFY